MNLPNEYFEWLSDIVLTNKKSKIVYAPLMRILSQKEFFWFINNDDNREADGKELRKKYESYISSKGIPVKIMSQTLPCSMLEMLVALSIRVDGDIMYDPEYGDEPDKWFWLMMKNCGLQKATKSEIETNGIYGIKYVNHILNRILNRTYDYQGTGGLFPIKDHNCPDQRETEIWYQLNRYLIENYSMV